MTCEINNSFGLCVTVCTCWLVCHGVHLLAACVSWCAFVGLCVMVCTCWLVCHGVYLLAACVSWCAFVGLCVMVCTCCNWLVRVTWCVHGLRVAHARSSLYH